jgi:hypothetical protein
VSHTFTTFGHPVIDGATNGVVSRSEVRERERKRERKKEREKERMR